MPDQFPRVVHVDGNLYPDGDGTHAPEGLFPPFYVFDSILQDYPRGPFQTREEARQAGEEYCATLDDGTALEPDPEWSGSPCPDDPDNYWIDDRTGERIKA